MPCSSYDKKWNSTRLSLKHSQLRCKYGDSLIKIQPDATVCRYLFTAKSLYMFQVSQHPSSGVLKTVTAASSTGHNTGTATSLQCGRSGHIGGKYLEVSHMGKLKTASLQFTAGCKLYLQLEVRSSCE